MSGLISRLRSRLKGEDQFVHAVEDASKTDIVERWDAIRMARRRLFAPALFGAVGTAGLALGHREAHAQSVTPFLSWPFRSSIGGLAPNNPGTPATANTAGISSRSSSDRVLDNSINIAEFYPPQLAAGTPFTVTPGVTVMRNFSLPISNFYSTLALAQNDYPFLTNTTDEIDWAAWQAALLYLYNRDNGLGTGIIRVPHGIARINRTITCACGGAHIIGEGTAVYPTQLRWSGSGVGTKDAPNYIMQFQTATELGVAVKQLGSSIATQASNGGANWIEHILFQGNGSSLQGLLGTESNFISGLRVSAGNGFRVNDCQFSGVLWDGLVFSGALTWTFVEKCFFQNIYRDCLAFWPVLGNFSTTMNVHDNNFANWGRYAILINVSATGATPVVSGNLFENQNNPSYFLANPQWFVHGVPANNALVGCTQCYWTTSYLELSVANFGFLHLADSGLGEVSNQYGSFDSPALVISASINQPANTIASWSGTTLTLTGTQSGASTFYPGMALIGTIATIAGNTTAGSAVVTGLSSTSALVAGLAATTGAPPSPSNTNILQGTLIASVDSASQITLNAPARQNATATNITFSLPPGARIASGTSSPFTVSPSLAIPGTFAISGYYLTPDAVAYLNTNGYYDITDTRNLWCGGATSAYPTSSPSSTGNTSAIKIKGFGSLFTVGAITVTGLNQIDFNTASTMADFALDVAHGRAALAVCQAGTLNVTGGVLTVDTTGNSSPFPFGAGQTVYNVGLGGLVSPSRSFGKAIAQISTGGTGSGGAGTYNMAGTQALGTSSARFIMAIAMTAKDIDSFGTFSGAANALWENSYTAGGVYQPNLLTSYGRWYKTLEARQAIQDSTQELWAFGLMTIRTASNVAPSSGSFLQGSQWWNTTPKPGSFQGWVCTTQGTIGSGGVVSAAGHVIGPTTVSQLPTPVTALKGAICEVTDSASTVFGGTVTGGGSNSVLVHCNGTAWTVMGI